MSGLASALTPSIMQRAWTSVRRGSGYSRAVRRFGDGLEANLERLRRSMLEGTYQPAPTHPHLLPRPDKPPRVLAIPRVEDRVAQRAVLELVTPRAERLFLAEVHGYRPRRSPATAVRQLLHGLSTSPHLELVQADVTDLFGSLEHRRLLRAISAVANDPLWLRLSRQWMHAWSARPGRGIPQGAPLSPLLANLFLHQHVDLPLRRWQRSGLHSDVLRWIRYGDDLVLLGRRPGSALRSISWLASRARSCDLQLSPPKTHLVASAGAACAPVRVLGHPLRLSRRGANYALTYNRGHPCSI